MFGINRGNMAKAAKYMGFQNIFAATRDVTAGIMNGMGTNLVKGAAKGGGRYKAASMLATGVSKITGGQLSNNYFGRAARNAGRFFTGGKAGITGNQMMARTGMLSAGLLGGALATRGAYRGIRNRMGGNRRRY